MSFDVINGYSKQTFNEILDALTLAVNAQFNTDYTRDTIVGSNHFKSFYAGMQIIMSAENKINELGNKIIDYIRTTNESIAAPASSPDGTVSYFKKNLGFDVSLRAITDVSLAGKPAIAVDVDPTRADFASVKQQIFDALRVTQTEGLYWYNPSTTAAANEYRGESSALNGQAFPYAFFTPRATTLNIRILITRSRDNLSYQQNATQISEQFVQNFNDRYVLGRDFEGERYLSVCDVPSAANVIVQWSKDGQNWSDSVLQSAFDEKFKLGTVVVTEQ